MESPVKFQPLISSDRTCYNSACTNLATVRFIARDQEAAYCLRCWCVYSKHSSWRFKEFKLTL
jgi:hypothetical protein